jgi:hypothetical protein
MPKTEDEHRNVVEPRRHTEDDSVRFGRYLLHIIVVIVAAYVLLHFISKYW